METRTNTGYVAFLSVVAAIGGIHVDQHVAAGGVLALEFVAQHLVLAAGGDQGELVGQNGEGAVHLGGRLRLGDGGGG